MVQKRFGGIRLNGRGCRGRRGQSVCSKEERADIEVSDIGRERSGLVVESLCWGCRILAVLEVSLGRKRWWFRMGWRNWEMIA